MQTKSLRLVALARHKTIVAAIVNRKGGVGKTTTTANLAAALARRGLRVLVIDSDSQKNLTTHIGDRQRDPAAYTINEAYRSSKVTAQAIAPSTIAGVDLLYGSSQLAETVIELVTTQHPALGLIMRRIVTRAVDEHGPYDYVLIDCPPDEGLLTRNAITAADLVLMPVQTEYFSIEGIGSLKTFLLKLQSQECFDELDDSVPPVLALATMLDERANTAKTLNELIQQFTSDDHGITTRPLKTAIHRNQALVDCIATNRSIFEYDRSQKTTRRGIREFTSLAKELEAYVD